MHPDRPAAVGTADALGRRPPSRDLSLAFRGTDDDAATATLLSENIYGRAWQKARQEALTPAQARSPLAGRPYDLRQSRVTLQLNAGVPAPEIARCAGRGVAVLLRVYAGCIDGQEQLWNSRIDNALRDDDTP